MSRRSIRIPTFWALVTLLLACAGPPPASADEGDEARQRVRFRVESAREVPNDWIVAVVGIDAEDVDPAALADTVNRSMGWALEQARAEKRVESKSGGYHTQPVYEKGKLRRWRARQDLILEGADADAIAELVGTLQSRLLLRSFQFQISEPTRAAVEEELVAEALAAFQKRAELVRKSLGASGWVLDDVSIDTGGFSPRPEHMVRARAMSADSVTAPAFEAGESRIVVGVNGSIALE
ncbi:MAG: SIMPL domain-containing protein [Myxococcota bacterium]